MYLLTERKRFFIGLLIAAMITVFTACQLSSSPSQTTTPQPSPPPQPSQPSSNQTAGEGGQQAPAGKEPVTVEEIALYDGPDRNERLVEAAKKEGRLSIYTSIPQEDIQKIATEFQKQYGIQVEVWRLSANNVLQRVITEAQAGQYAFDLVSIGSVDIEALSKERMLQRVYTPFAEKLIPESIPSHREWLPLYYNIFVHAYNTNSVKPEEVPKTYEEMLDPRWKGRMAIESGNFEWFAAVVEMMGEEKGIQFFKDLVAKNDLQVRTGNSLLAEMVASGEVPFAITVYSFKTRQLKANGAPLEWYAIEPAFARSTGVALSKKANNPNAAMLFLDFMLDEGQRILKEIYYDPSNQDFKPPENLKLQFLNEEKIMAEHDKWSRLYQDIVVNGVLW